MGLSRIQSIVSRLSAAEHVRKKLPYTYRPDLEVELDGKLKKVRRDLLLAGLKEFAGHNQITFQEIPVKKFTPVPLIISTTPLEEGAQGPTFGLLLANELNRCTKNCLPSEEQFARPVKPTDRECLRSESMIRSLLANLALDHCNTAPEAVLDPVTPAEMAAFGFPGGLLSGRTSPQLGLTPQA